MTLNITNTGNVDLENVTLNSSLPTGWTVTYNTENNMIPSIPAGSTTEVIAHVKPSSEAITGDYVNTFTASCEQTQSNADFRGHHPVYGRRPGLCVPQIRQKIACMDSWLERGHCYEL